MRLRLIPWFLLALSACGGSVPVMSKEIPEFTHTLAADWINSDPLRLADLRGQVVLVEFWTFDCINCRNTLPWMKSIHDQYASQGLRVISVHTPELPQERDPDNVRAAVKEFGITYPVMLDGNFSYWRALNNRYWPAFYLVGRDGRIADSAIGELHKGQRRGDEMEAAIRTLLASKP
jgi:thiol-disulfide isomerase/thioredoxin